MTNPLQRKRRWRVCRTTTLIPICLISTIIIAFYIMMHESAPPPSILSHSPTPTHLLYTPVPNFFAQSLATTDDKTFNPLTSNFGLIAQPYDTDADFPGGKQWQRFAHKLMTLNAASEKSISYRLLFLSRHGEGYHNVAERFIGTDKWDCYYSTLNGSREISWADAMLTPLGVQQAEEARDSWARQIKEEGMRLPEVFYVSPLSRAVRTAGVSFADLVGEREFRLIVKEGLREGIGIHTCDRRSSKREIREAFPKVEIEEGFEEEDPLWLPDLREPGTAQTVRLRGLLDDVFTHDGSILISMTSHGGTIQSILRAVGHREFGVPTGGLIPVLVKVEVVQGERERKEAIPWEGKPECENGEPGEREVGDTLRRLDESVKGTRL